MTTNPDSPCIAICDVLYKDICSGCGCGRHFLEVSGWTGFTAEQKAAVWLRIDTERTALRYTTYKDRVQ